jgi:hypothetical protein
MADENHPKSDTHVAPLQYDEARYLPMVEDLDITDEQARALLRSIWDILVMIADIGVGIDPVQILLNAPLENCAWTDENGVRCETQKAAFRDAAQNKPNMNNKEKR